MATIRTKAMEGLLTRKPVEFTRSSSVISDYYGELVFDRSGEIRISEGFTFIIFQDYIIIFPAFKIIGQQRDLATSAGGIYHILGNRIPGSMAA